MGSQSFLECKLIIMAIEGFSTAILMPSTNGSPCWELRRKPLVLSPQPSAWAVKLAARACDPSTGVSQEDLELRPQSDSPSTKGVKTLLSRAVVRGGDVQVLHNALLLSRA